jgi:hypothetical protein
VHRSVDGGAAVSVAMVNVANCTFVDMDVDNGHNYSYSIHAVNAVGDGALSAWIETTPAGRPGQPVSISWTTGETSAAITWSEPLDDGGSPIIGYSIYMGIDGSDPVMVGNVSALERSWAQVGLQKNHTYQFFVTAINAIGEGMPSGSISLSPKSTEVVYVTTNIEDRIPVATLSSGVVILLGMTGSVLFWRGRKARAKEFAEAVEALESLI